MATPNETSDLQTRIQQAKAWLQERDNEEAEAITTSVGDSTTLVQYKLQFS